MKRNFRQNRLTTNKCFGQLKNKIVGNFVPVTDWLQLSTINLIRSLTQCMISNYKLISIMFVKIKIR